ncbi:siderophore-interacting protein [Nakamurella deserti]|uniref:siderophore-interacting protein n=1 Tax=Nakamurella deserti TaxID=2164074 RepID=UPI000DBEA1DF|nr:siderophore-interacting protein [Nakamurella deserti]
MAAAGQRRRGGQHALVVQRIERLAPHLIRVHLGGPGFATFMAAAHPDRLAATDTYVKILFARPGSGLTPPYDLAALREVLEPEDLPVQRTYTIRAADPERETLTVDFVVHGTDGVAGPWAVAARPGDVVSISDPGGQYAPSDDPAVEHLFAGDATALPAIAAALESLTPDATGHVFVEVHDAHDEIALPAPAGVAVRWLHQTSVAGTGLAPGELLTAVVCGLPRPAGPVQVFAHGERAAMKAIGRFLTGVWGLDRRELSLSAYWALGRAEDRFQAEKREPVGQILD